MKTKPFVIVWLRLIELHTVHTGWRNDFCSFPIDSRWNWLVSFPSSPGETVSGTPLYRHFVGSGSGLDALGKNQYSVCAIN